MYVCIMWIIALVKSDEPLKSAVYFGLFRFADLNLAVICGCAGITISSSPPLLDQNDFLAELLLLRTYYSTGDIHPSIHT